MNTRNIVILITVLALLGGSLWYRKTSMPPKDLVTADSLRAFVPETLDLKSVDAVELARPNGPVIRLERTNGQWLLPGLGGAPANGQSVTGLLDALQEMRGEFRSSDPDIVADYGLSDDEALRLSLFSAGVEHVRLLFGKGDFRNLFLRTANSAEVFVAPGVILGRMGAHSQTLSEQFWIDTGLLSLNWEDIQELRLTTPDQEAVLKRVAGNGEGNATVVDAWEFFQNKGEGLTQARLEDALTVLDRVSVHEALPTDSAEREKLDAPTHRLDIVTTSGLITLEAVKEETGALIRRAGSPHIYRMHDTVFDRLFPSPSPDAE